MVVFPEQSKLTGFYIFPILRQKVAIFKSHTFLDTVLLIWNTTVCNPHSCAFCYKLIINKIYLPNLLINGDQYLECGVSKKVKLVFPRENDKKIHNILLELGFINFNTASVLSIEVQKPAYQVLFISTFFLPLRPCCVVPAASTVSNFSRN